jgi:hypothetical protein
MRTRWRLPRKVASAALAVASAVAIVGARAEGSAVANRSTAFRSGFFVVSASTGRALPGVPVFHKRIADYGDVPDIDAIVSDGRGGWYVGGDFTAVDQTPCMNLVHLRLGQTVKPASCFPTNGTVLALARRGDKLFIGGLFTKIRKQNRNYAAAIDTRTDALSTWDAHLAAVEQGAHVDTIAISRNVVYLGGVLLAAGGSFVDVAALDIATARPLPGWHSVRLSTPKNSSYVEVAALATTGDRVFVAGYPYGLVEVNAHTGSEVARAQPLHSSPGDVDSPVLDSVAATSSTVYIGGFFARIGNVHRSGVAALNPRTLRPTAWKTSIPPYNTAKSTYYSEIVAILVQPKRVYVAGQFYAPHLTIGVATFDPATGRRLPWLINAHYEPEQIQALAVFHNTVAFGPGICKRTLTDCASPTDAGS